VLVKLDLCLVAREEVGILRKVGMNFFVSYLWSFKHLTVDQAQIPPLSSQVKAFFIATFPPWETMLLLAESTAGKVKQLCLCLLEVSLMI